MKKIASKTATKSKGTLNKGFNMHTDNVKAYLYRQLKKSFPDKVYSRGYSDALNELLVWLEGQAKRTAAKKGGAGRK